MDSRTLPLLNHPLEEPSAFTPEALISAVRSERRLPDTPVPQICVLDFDGDLTDWLVERFNLRPCPAWACFHTKMVVVEVDGRKCGLIPRTIGGPYAVFVAEQLAASGVQVILGLTSAGRVRPDVPIPRLIVATSAIRDEGTSYHYIPPGIIVEACRALTGALLAGFAASGVPALQGAVWTTDAPYRETAAQLAEHAAGGVLAVEMQAASLFAFAAARKVPVGIVAQVSNALDHSGQPLDTGDLSNTYAVMNTMCRAGYQFLRNRMPSGEE